LILDRFNVRCKRLYLQCVPLMYSLSHETAHLDNVKLLNDFTLQGRKTFRLYWENWHNELVEHIAGNRCKYGYTQRVRGSSLVQG
jgi:hypothetical protein